MEWFNQKTSIAGIQVSNWDVPMNLASDEYAQRVTHAWRRRWLDRARTRLSKVARALIRRAHQVSSCLRMRRRCWAPVLVDEFQIPSKR
jgi:hypothetical protein